MNKIEKNYTRDKPSVTKSTHTPRLWDVSFPRLYVPGVTSIEANETTQPQNLLIYVFIGLFLGVPKRPCVSGVTLTGTKQNTISFSHKVS